MIGCSYDKWKRISTLDKENQCVKWLVWGQYRKKNHSLSCAWTHALCVDTCFSFAAGFLPSEETPLFSTYCRANIYLFNPDTCLCVKWTTCVFCIFYFLVPKSVHLLPVWLAHFWCGDTSVALGLADVCANAARMFTLNHVGSRQTPCCCRSYGLVLSCYWLLVELKAGERLIKDTRVCVWKATDLAVVLLTTWSNQRSEPRGGSC